MSLTFCTVSTIGWGSGGGVGRPEVATAGAAAPRHRTKVPAETATARCAVRPRSADVRGAACLPMTVLSPRPHTVKRGTRGEVTREATKSGQTGMSGAGGASEGRSDLGADVVHGQPQLATGLVHGVAGDPQHEHVAEVLGGGRQGQVDPLGVAAEADLAQLDAVAERAAKGDADRDLGPIGGPGRQLHAELGGVAEVERV